MKRGEAIAKVTATGTRTKFGQTAELVRTASVVSSQQKAVLKIVRNLAFFNGAIILLMGVYALTHSMPRSEIVPLFLTAVLAAIPVGLPATFTLSSAIGARSLAKLGVLPTRLSAVDEAGTIGVLCEDKTGTLTANQLSVTSVVALNGFHEEQVLGIAALASSVGGQDSVDAAIQSASGKKRALDTPKLVTFTAFDPAKKTSQATATDANGQAVKIVKGAFATIVTLAVGKYKMHMEIGHLRTFCVIAIVYGGQAITYAVRDREHLWGLVPTKWLVLSSAADMLFISLLANRGIEMSPLSLSILASELLAATIFFFALNFVKVPIFRRLNIR